MEHFTLTSTEAAAAPSDVPLGARRQTGGAAVASNLARLGVRHVFGIVSVHNLPIFDAIAHDDRMTMVPVRHEQAAVHAADAYARTTGALAVALVSTGPGTANAMGGLFEAASASSPVLLITGQVPTLQYGKRRGALHEADAQLAMLRTVCRSTATVRRTEDISAVLDGVAREMLTGRKAPGAVEIPIDLQYREASVPVLGPFIAPEPAAPDAPAIEAAAALLRSAERPIIYAGGGVISAGAWDALAALANKMAAPVLTTIPGRGSLPEVDPLCLGPMPTRSSELREILEAADVMLAVGTRFQGLATRFWTLPMPRQLIHLDADPGVIGLSYPATVALVGDARVGLERLAAAIDRKPAERVFATWARERRDRARQASRAQIGPDHEAMMDTLRELLPADANIVRDSTIPAYLWGDRLLPIMLPRTSVHPMAAGIGPGLPFAIGAAVGTGRLTALIQGDGGLMLSLGELSTLAERALPVIVCVFNDRGYGIIRSVEDRRFGRQSGVDLATPDFVALARSCGIAAERVDTVSGFRAAVNAGVSRRGPYLIDIDLTAFAPADVGRMGSE